MWYAAGVAHNQKQINNLFKKQKQNQTNNK